MKKNYMVVNNLLCVLSLAYTGTSFLLDEKNDGNFLSA